MVVLHQLEQKGIPWEVFIAHEVFTNPQPHHHPNLPSSSHPAPFTPPSPPIDHASSSTQVSSPQENIPSSPSQNASDQKESGSEQVSDKETDDNDDVEDEEVEVSNQT